MTDLLLPAHATALRLDKARQVIGPPADYEILPWFDGTRDHNGSVPNLASAINAEPFSDHHTWLDKGVHLHWTLPDSLKRGSTQRSALRSVKVGDLWMPPAPNRWLVTRSVATDAPTPKWTQEKTWLVESDYVHQGTLRPNNWAIAYPRETRTANQPPYLFLGRQIELHPKTGALMADSRAKPIDAKTTLAAHGAPLTALGPGDPLFAAHYPSCKSVFGLFDDKPAPIGQSVMYDIYGWYSEDVGDPLNALMVDMYQDPSSAISRVLRDADATGKDFDFAPENKEFNQTQWTKLGKTHLEEQLGVSIPQDIDDLPHNALVHARVVIKDNVTEAPKPEKAVRIGIGSSAPEAFAALLAGKRLNPLDEETENRLVQTLAATDLTDHHLDLGQKLVEARHNEQFKAHAGHAVWVIRPKGGSKDNAKSALTLAEDLAHELNTLNTLQEAFDTQCEAIDGLKQDLFTDWHRYMRAVYPEGDSDPFGFDVNAARALLERTRLTPLENMIHDTGRLYHAQSAEGDMLVTDQWQPAGAVSEEMSLPFAFGLLEGYEEGESFADVAAPGDRITQVRINAGAIVDSVSLTTSTQQPRRGGGGGDEHDFALDADDYITAISGDMGPWGSANVISWMTIETHKGRMSERRERRRAGDSPFRIQAPKGHAIVGLRGRAGAYLHAIGVIVAPLETGASQQTPAPETLPPYNPHSFAARIVQQHRVVLARLTTGLHSDRKLHISLAPGPRYWQPNDPVIVLDDDHVRPRERHGHSGAHVDHKDSTSARSVAFVFELSQGWVNSGAAFAGNRRVPLNPGGIDVLAEKTPSWTATQGHEHWDPVQLEWEAEVRPLARQGNSAGGAYHSDFVLGSQKMRTNHPDLEPAKQNPKRAQTYQYFAGRSVLNPSAGRLLKKRLAGLPNALKQEISPAQSDNAPIVLPLGGFHDQLLMRRPEPQIDIADVIGLPHQKELADRVAGALQGFHPSTPVEDHAFHPIRSGTVTLERLRVVDTFGRTRDWRPTEVHTTQRMKSAKTEPRSAHLPVRLSQPARLNFRWLSAAHDDVESNAHPATSPICGWILPNDLDGALAVYGRTGRMLGNVVAGNKWQPAPGDDDAPRSWREMSDIHLARVVRWLTEPKDTDFTGAFLETLDRALEMIDPKDAARHQARALLIGRPLALVRARLSLSSLHHAALDQSNRSYLMRLAGGGDDDHGFTDVKIPVRMGEHGQLNDGLCGYWIESGAGFEQDEFHLPHGLDPEIDDPRIRMSAQDSLKKLPLSFSMNDAPVTLSMLVDPQGAVHATSGILPTKSISIPPDQYQEQIAGLRATFRTAPVLTPMDQVEIPLPSEPGFSWSWLQRQGRTWVNIPHHPTITKAQIMAAFGTKGDALWAILTEHERIVPVDNAGEGELMPEDTNAPTDRYDALGLTVELVERGLHALARSIHNTERGALYRGRPVAREGWLELRPAPEPSNRQDAPKESGLNVDWSETS